MRIIWALAVKDLRLLLFDRIGFFFVFLWPLIFVIFFGYVTAGLYQSGSNPAQPIPLVVVDEDGSDGSREYLKSLNEYKALKVDAAENRGEADAMVRKGQRTAYLIVRRGFGAASERIFWGNPMELELVVDPARPMESGITQGLIQASAFRSIQDLFSDPKRRQRHIQLAREDIRNSSDLPASRRLILEAFLDAVAMLYEKVEFSGQSGLAGTTDSKTAKSEAAGGMEKWEPVRVYVHQFAEQNSETGSQKTSLNSFSVSFPQGILWGVMACAASFALSLAAERTRGTLPRLTMAPIHPWQIIAGKGLACFMSTLCVCIGMVVIGRLAFGVCPSSYLLMILAVACLGFAVVGIMMLFSVMGKTEASVGGFSWAALILMAMFGGGMIPLVAMKGWMVAVGSFSIFRWGIQALEGAIWRDYGLADIAWPCGVLLMIGVGGLIIGTCVFRLRGDQ